MDKVKVAGRLIKLARQLIAQDPMEREKLSKLYLLFERWATKMGATKPPRVALQVLKGLEHVRDKLKGKGNLRGRAAVEALLMAMKGKFTTAANPIPTLIRKYGTDEIMDIWYRA